MAYDQKLAERIRALVHRREGVSEKEMFGGLAFMRDGKMFAGVIKDELMARVGKEAHAAWQAKPGARLMDFAGRPMAGYLYVKQTGLAGKKLGEWVEACWTHVNTVEKSAKRAKKTKK